jgi:hypothetical protein
MGSKLVTEATRRLKPARRIWRQDTSVRDCSCETDRRVSFLAFRPELELRTGALDHSLSKRHAELKPKHVFTLFSNKGDACCIEDQSVGFHPTSAVTMPQKMVT